ncbi:hypothetical protein [Nonomuraea sp. NPDC002799]
MTPLTPVDPQRLVHVQGERLARRDFDDQGRLDDQVRWWHNRALHHAYGVVRGLTVTIEAGGATVQPGLAYDCHGRELILHSRRTVALPGEEPSYLVLTHTGGEPALRWVPRRLFAAADGVPLHEHKHDATPLYPNEQNATPPHANGQDTAPPHANGQDTAPPHANEQDAAPLDADEQGSTFTPPRARPQARPLIGHGATVTGQTPWLRLTRKRHCSVRAFGIEVAVDTSAAGFTGTPCYFAQLTGSLVTPAEPDRPFVPLGHIAQATKDGFRYRLLMPWLHQEERDAAQVAALARSTGLAVTWIGIQQLQPYSSHQLGDGGTHELH